MTPPLIAVLLGFMVLAAWLGAAGFARLHHPLDRLHCVTFINVACGTALLLAAFLADGASSRVAKILLMVAANIVTGAAVSHVTGRAVLRAGAAE